MRFDAARVIEMAEWLGGFRRRNDGREEELVRLVEEGFRDLGWSVNRPGGFVVASRPSSAPARVVVQIPHVTTRLGMWRWRLGRALAWIQGREIEAPDRSDLGTCAGLGFLMELARTWPGSRSSRVDLILAVPEGDRDMTDAELDPRPTLLLDVLAPGVGRGILIAGRRSDLVLEAARDLWIPHRRNRVITTLLPMSAVILGDGHFEGETATIDPGALDRTAQLVTEVALRWGKSHARNPAAQDDDRRNAPRSSQNPG
ncbi:hypothetical protein [Aquisphaera insulae]|uniref:hypothetical protein n=1 Tax=Aquisphaera insulae TaxID=2712864 RepID=UPI0013E9E855|nr:hypothetical protein [Aquisphaera insulae]